MGNLVKVVSVTKKKHGKNDALALEYEHLSGKFQGQVWTISGLALALPAEDRELLLKSKPGDNVVIDRKSNEGKDRDGNPKTFWALSSVLPPSSLNKQPTASDNHTSSHSKSHTTTTTSNHKAYDDTGIKVGASRNQAIAFLAATRGNKFTLDDVDKVAMEIVHRQAAQEELVRIDFVMSEDEYAKLLFEGLALPPYGGNPSKEHEDHDQDLEPMDEHDDGPIF